MAKSAGGPRPLAPGRSTLRERNRPHQVDQAQQRQSRWIH